MLCEIPGHTHKQELKKYQIPLHIICLPGNIPSFTIIHRTHQPPPPPTYAKSRTQIYTLAFHLLQLSIEPVSPLPLQLKHNDGYHSTSTRIHTTLYYSTLRRQRLHNNTHTHTFNLISPVRSFLFCFSSLIACCFLCRWLVASSGWLVCVSFLVPILIREVTKIAMT